MRCHWPTWYRDLGPSHVRMCSVERASSCTIMRIGAGAVVRRAPCCRLPPAAATAPRANYCIPAMSCVACAAHQHVYCPPFARPRAAAGASLVVAVARWRLPAVVAVAWHLGALVWRRPGHVHAPLRARRSGVKHRTALGGDGVPKQLWRSRVTH